MQFAGHGVSFLLHKSHDALQEEIELHHLDLNTNFDAVVTRYRHAPQTRSRPSLWRGSLSPDGSILVYQHDVLQPVITVVDGKEGRPISQIRWKEDLTALPVHIDPLNELIVIPLAHWNAQYQYGAVRKLLVANLKTGEILGKYDSPWPVNHVRFLGKNLVVIDSANNVGRMNVNSSVITWKQFEETRQQSRQFFLHVNAERAGYFSRVNNDETGEFQQVANGPVAIENRFTLQKGYVPLGLRGRMLVSEKNTVRELPGWIQKINERFAALFGHYLVSPLEYAIRYQDASTGELLAEHRLELRTQVNYATHRESGAIRLAAISLDQDHLCVEFRDVFSLWTFKTIAILAGALTFLVYCLARWNLTFLIPKKLKGLIIST